MQRVHAPFFALIFLGTISVFIGWLTLCRESSFLLFSRNPSQFLRIKRRFAADPAKLRQPFVACRLDYYQQLHDAGLILSHLPTPTSLFVKHETIRQKTIAYLVVVAFGRGRRDEETGELLNVQPDGCIRGRPRRHWFHETKWSVSWQSSRFGCMIVPETLKTDSIVLKCPLSLEVADNANQFTVSVRKDDKDYIIGRNLPVCNLDLPKYRLTACATVADYHRNLLPEWIEYHSMIGFEHFFIYVSSMDFSAYERFLDVYVNKLKLVTLIPSYSEDYSKLIYDIFLQRSVYQDCLYRLKGRADWMAVIDVDEFITIQKGNNNLADYLDKYYEFITSSGFDGGGLLVKRKNCAYHPNETSTPCKGDGLFSRITTMTFRSPDFMLKPKSIVRVDKTVYANVHKVLGKNNGNIFVPDNKVYVLHFRDLYRHAFIGQVNGGRVVEDTEFTKTFGEAVLSRLWERGFVGYSKTKICLNETETSKSVFQSACRSVRMDGRKITAKDIINRHAYDYHTFSNKVEKYF